MNSIDFKDEDLQFLKSVIRRGGQILLENYENPSGIERKSDGSLVSEVDKKSARFITKSLVKRFPNFAIIDEEIGNDTSLEKEYCWVIDPLDNTRGYLAKENTFSILICLLRRNVPIFGISYRPLLDELVYSIKGKGTYLEDSSGIRKLHASDSQNLDVLISKSRSSEELEKLIKKIAPKKIRKMGGSTKIIELAKGTASVFVSPKVNVMHTWDLCATSLILEEAGGIITDIGGNPLEFKRDHHVHHLGILAASNKLLHQTILKKII
ncbi:hypothetical protein CMI37_26070 [Candidatus Pacearchaeota archaeon]|nr:hypothetical protein [Candidatus Pacearchaeota archaeon]|tara:strand:- start:20561 stop:21361 length:801 start_codon:yes stop_codon:yes gene_type:complete